ncbi:MAG: hypothetical protein AAGL89_11780 [Pseudomonadota bacterium]
MIFKIVSLFLIGMGVLAMFGKWTVPGQKAISKRLSNAKCGSCGRFTFGKTCDCKGRG